MNLNYFSLSEFDCPSIPNSGVNMDKQFLTKLESAREIAGIPFKITSGYRSVGHNKEVGGGSKLKPPYWSCSRYRSWKWKRKIHYT